MAGKIGAQLSATRSRTPTLPTATLREVIEAEVEKYRRMPAREPDTPCLQWWKETGTPALPVVRLAARGRLSLQANSCTAERVFSSLGLLISSLRSELDPYQANMLMFIRMNKDLYKHYLL